MKKNIPFPKICEHKKIIRLPSVCIEKKLEKIVKKTQKQNNFFQKIRLLTALSNMAFDPLPFDKKAQFSQIRLERLCDSLILIDFAEIVREAKAIRLSPLAILL